ncbi:MAG: TIGR02206 family membrane protein [Candidatus Izemoplasmatales bacterium]
MKDFFSSTVGITFEPFGVYHIIILFITFLAIFLVYQFRLRIRLSKHEKAFRYTLAFIGIFFELSLHLWQIFNGIWTYQDSFPLALCFISLVLGIYVMFTKSYSAFEIGYFWAIGAVASILFPDIPYGPDRFRFYQFLFSHMNFFIMFMYMVFVHQYYPTFKSFKKSIIYLILLVFCIVLPIDYFTNANFLFLINSAGTPFEIFEGYGYGIYLLGIVSLSILVEIIWFLPIYFFTKNKLKA